MIALALLLLTALYLFLLYQATKARGRWRVFFVVALLGPVIYVIWDMPVGYLMFRHVCEAEGGLRIYEKNPPPASVLRMQDHYYASDAEDMLRRYPSLAAVEAVDRKVSYTTPRIHTTYRRAEDGSVQTEVLDRYEGGFAGRYDITLGASRADYVLSDEYEKRPIRLSITRRWLKTSAGSPVASANRIVYLWTNPSHTVYAANVQSVCGSPTAPLNELLELIATPRK